MLRDVIFSITAIISIGSGLWAILLINRLQSRYRLNYLNSYLYNLIMLFVFGIYGLIGMAVVDTFLKEMDAPESMIESIVNFLPYLGIPFLIAAWYLFIKMSLEMVAKRIKNIYTIIYFILMLLILLGSGFLVFSFYDPQSAVSQRLTGIMKMFFVGVDGTVFLFAFFILLNFGIKTKDATTRKMIVNFALINLFVKTLLILLFMFSNRDSYLGAVYLLVFFSGNLPAVLFLYSYIRKHLKANTDGHLEKSIESFTRDYSISKREWEIIEKICGGLTNKQISDALFISLQTVKDHTHHIYKKNRGFKPGSTGEYGWKT